MVVAFLLFFFIAQATPQREAVSAEQVKAAIDRLGNLEFSTRMEAGRTVRRAAPPVAVPALRAAVAQHKDEYVRFRALVILSGFNDPGTRDIMLRMLGDRNDRVRTVAYAWFEHNPDVTALPRLLEALDKEDSEFVRPALTRAVIAHAAKDAKAREISTVLVMRGQDMFRAAAIEALGDHKGAFALQPITQVAKLDGPLQDDAVLAIGRIGDKRGLETLAAVQRSAPRNLQPSIAAAICLLGSNCDAHQRYIIETLKFGVANPGYQELVRGAAAALAALGASGREDAAATLFELGAPTRDPERAAIALAIGSFALRNTPLLLKAVERQAAQEAAVELLREAFDMLEEDYLEEQFFVAVRRAYWASAENSPQRRAAEMLIKRLEF
jgi:hypothetical protein